MENSVFVTAFFFQEAWSLMMILDPDLHPTGKVISDLDLDPTVKVISDMDPTS